MSTTKKLPTLPDAEVLYQHWVYEGLSLRKIGRIYGRSRTTIWTAIRARYGNEACNPKMQGLSRVIAQEYGRAYQNTVEATRNISGRYLTRRKEQNLTTFQGTELKESYRTVCEKYLEVEERTEGLKLPLFLLFCQALTDILTIYL
ncbi:MAG: helix-turn-helix domain-containing protein [Trichormus sp. ATA11-4-KO1]|jgi:hypothetical protein|nr:helix-turn-helix domain-containing protein [Trichormus sp. ATA11-4-KO1]